MADVEDLKKAYKDVIKSALMKKMLAIKKETQIAVMDDKQVTRIITIHASK